MMSDTQLDNFATDGFLVVPGFNNPEQVDAARERFEPLFRGEFETGLQPDEWNWRQSVSDSKLTRQICNGWKSDRAIARLVLSERVGAACARLMGWPGCRINQDNVIWKSAGAKALGFHQDDAYQQWIEPATMVTCWMALDDTRQAGGTIEYVRGSHLWPMTNSTGQFHAPTDYHEALAAGAKRLGITDYDIVKLEVKAGDVVFHHGRTWHGSGVNQTSAARRSVVSHCMRNDTRYHRTNVGPIYGRYKTFGSDLMQEDFFPILWTTTGDRSYFLSDYLSGTP
jgi:ectoine hydroxylase-related dioxygenase (phytanoyl-CoA dioxygenase family)